MDLRRKYGIIGSVVLSIAGIISYTNHWESKEPEIYIEGAKIESVSWWARRSSQCMGPVPTYDLGENVRLVGDNRVIQFPRTVWDDNFTQGDVVDITAKRKFPFPLCGERLKGLGIKRSEE